MPTLERSALLAHSADSLYRMVADIERYPEFLPGCSGAKLLACESEGESQRVRASLAFRVKGISDSFETENTLVPGERIDMQLVQGPFRKLSGAWCFLPLSEQACKVQLIIDLDLGSRMLQMTLGPWIDRGVNGVVEAFVRRAGQLYGKPPVP